MLLFKSFRGKKRWKEKSLIIIDLILAEGENTNNSKLIQPPAVKNNLSLGKKFCISKYRFTLRDFSLIL